MSRLLCCLARRPDMGAALSQPQEGEVCEGGVPAAPPTMADVIRERKKKAAGSGLGTLRRRIALVRRPRDNRPDRGCEHARFIRGVVVGWRLCEVFLLAEELEAGAALRDLATQADLAREPAASLRADLAAALQDRLWCDVELVGSGWSVPAHRAVLAARCTYFRDLLHRYPPSVVRVPLEGAAAGLSRAELEAVLLALYAGSQRQPCALCHKWDRNATADGDLDIINVEVSTGKHCVCRSRMDGAALRRAANLLGFSLDSLHRDMRYLLDSGELADARLVFRSESGSGAAYGFRSALELPCHRLVLAARSRFFRSVMSRRGTNNGGGAVCVDEKVLPRRFARALLHAAYTDTVTKDFEAPETSEVDLSLIGRNSSSPSSTNSSGGGSNGWSGVARGATRTVTTTMLDDAFQLYEIARFVEMAIVVQGCEDAIVEALSPETLPHVLRWAAAPHASQWVHRQAMRYLRDEFCAVMSSSGCGRVPAAALVSALRSPFVQAAEGQLLRALLRWAADQPALTESSALSIRATSGGRRGGRRREAGDGALRDALAPLVPLLRLEHLPPDHELMLQLVRRGILPTPPAEGSGSADAWLARGSYRPPRCFLPYLDEIKALLEDQAVPEAELARARRERYLHRIPDTLYMVAAERQGTREPRASGAGGGSPRAADACVSPRVRAALRARARLLRGAPPAARALRLPSTDNMAVYKQIALRAVREMSLPDACADLLLPDLDQDTDSETGASSEREGEERCSSNNTHCEDAWRWPDDQPSLDCCRTLSGSGSVRCASAGSLLHLPLENSRAATCRRELPARPSETSHQHRPVTSEGGTGRAPAGGTGRLSAAVPDVAMAPNANTHLLTARDYFRLTPWEYTGGAGGVLQLDLGDGATHTPRPGSRAARAGASHSTRPSRDHAQAMSCLRSRADEDELRAAIELSVMRAYSSFGSRAASAASAATNSNVAGNSLSQNVVAWRGTATLPPSRDHPELQLAPTHMPTANRGRAVGSPCGASGGGRLCDPHTPPHVALSRVGSSRSDSVSPAPSPRRPQDYLYRHHPTAHPHQHHDYRMDASYGSGSGSGSGSRGHSPNTYA